MTTLYEPDIINNSHAVKFKSPEPIDSLHYLDSNGVWRPCQIQDRLPYNLATYKFLDRTDGKVFVTCPDSYRLSVKPESETIDLKYEEAWRNGIYRDEGEMDYKHGDNWVKAKVCWLKEDIVPGVLLIGPRKHPKFNSFGYVYKDSKRLSEAGSKTGIISQEQLDKEEKERLEIERLCDEETKEIEELKKNLQQYRPVMYPQLSFYDIRPFYASLPKERDEITVERFGVDADSVKHLTPEQLVLLWLASNRNIKVAWSRKTSKTKVSDSRFCIKDTCNAICDIRIKNATYARYTIWSNDTDVLPLSKDGDDFVLEGIDMDNPLFNALMGSKHVFDTDGDIIEYKEIFLEVESYMKLTAINGGYSVSRLPSGKFIMAGHLWIPSLIVDEKDLEKVN